MGFLEILRLSRIEVGFLLMDYTVKENSLLLEGATKEGRTSRK